MHSQHQLFSASSRTYRAIAIILFPLIMAALACNFQTGGDQSLRETDIAIGVQQTLIAQTATALDAELAISQATLPAAQTPESQPEITEPPSPAPTEVATQPIVPTNTPEPSSTPASLAPQNIQLSDWRYVAFAPIKSGCKLDDAPCWQLKLSGSGLWKNDQPIEGTLTSREPVLIDPAWGNPALVFWHKFETTGFDYRVNLQINGKWVGVRQSKDNTTGWVQEVINLRDYKGENLNVSFASNVWRSWLTPNLKVSWYIQDVQIVPNYQSNP